MAGSVTKKRSREDAAKSKATRPSKKQRQLQAYHSDSEESADDDGGGEDFQAVNLLDSDEDDIHNAPADDGASSASDSSLEPESEAPKPQQQKPRQNSKPAPEPAPEPNQDDAVDSESDDEDEDEDEDDDDSSSEGGSRPRKKSKRNDPDAFATSLSKILSTKLSTSRRADPVLARSAEAHTASKEAVESALDTKARKRLREQKRLAMEKGRVRDVMVASRSATYNIVTGQVEEEDPEKGAQTTAQIMETERRLRKTAQRGVVKLFNAVRAAQVKATEAERQNRTEGVLGAGRREEKVTEMSRKGFLDLIASGGGSLKKGALEEA